MDGMLEELGRLQVVIPDPDAVRRYVLRYPKLTDSVPCAAGSCRTLFPTGTELSLHLYHDPEVDDEYLTLYVRPPAYNDSVSGMLDTVRQAVDDLLQGCDGWLLITTDYRQPVRARHGL